MFKVLSKTAMVLVIAAIYASPVIAQKNCQSDGFGGLRCSDGGGWQSDGFGGQRGTGNNTGSGWQSDRFGGQRGTGNNSGKTCASDGFGGLRCN